MSEDAEKEGGMGEKTCEGQKVSEENKGKQQSLQHSEVGQFLLSYSWVNSGMVAGRHQRRGAAALLR